MEPKKVVCPDCEGEGQELVVPRRDFLRTVGVTAAAAALPVWATPKAAAAPTPKSAAETAVKKLYDTLTDRQKKVVCFDWDHQDPARGLLRTYVSNNWFITRPHIRGKFFTHDQQDLIYEVFKGIINPEWEKRFRKQLKDDTGGAAWGAQQSIAIFGTPGSGKFEFVMTGRHMTLRADGDSTEDVAFGGPIFYGHAASGFHEKAHHPGNVFWPQALEANKVYQMLDGKQRKLALADMRPHESEVAFQGEKGKFTGIPVSELSADQKGALGKVLAKLVEPFRKEDRDEALECLKKRGGLDKCHLTFYKDGDIGKDEEWDNWRLEGPAFVWYFRGEPHVHVWVNVAHEPSVKTNAHG